MTRPVMMKNFMIMKSDYGKGMNIMLNFIDGKSE